jgi:hypothetical protein
VASREQRAPGVRVNDDKFTRAATVGRDPRLGPAALARHRQLGRRAPWGAQPKDDLYLASKRAEMSRAANDLMVTRPFLRTGRGEHQAFLVLFVCA